VANRRGGRAPDSRSKSLKSSRFDIGTLRELAGDKIFARGEEYFCGGLVEILSIEGDSVLARVAGSEDYRTQLTGRGEDIDGHCSCPAYVDWGFCKHMVATGLAANAASQEESQGGGVLPRIREHLKTKSVDDLANLILGLAERDTQLLRKLELAAATTQDDDGTLGPRLRRAIDNATRVNEYIDYPSARDWAAGINEALDAVEALASGARAAIALQLAERAIERIGRAFESIDDSDGHIGMLLNRAREIHFTAATASRPEPGQLARDLFALEMNDDFGAFHRLARLYAEVLGEAGLAEFRRLAETAWRKLEKRSTRSQDDSSPDLHQLIGILDFFAEREGDVDARIALRSKDLSSPYDYLKLAEFCKSQGRETEALRHAEEGLWMFEDGRPDERLVCFAADLLARAGRKDEAETHVWRAFEKEPSLELYATLHKLRGNWRAVAHCEHWKYFAKRSARGVGRGLQMCWSASS
jgi:tetratricopeptide (TPR) repeat protein